MTHSISWTYLTYRILEKAIFTRDTYRKQELYGGLYGNVLGAVSSSASESSESIEKVVILGSISRSLKFVVMPPAFIIANDALREDVLKSTLVRRA